MEFEERKSAFLVKYKALIDEFQVDLVAVPMFVQGQKGTWELVVSPQFADLKQQLVESPVKL